VDLEAHLRRIALGLSTLGMLRVAGDLSVIADVLHRVAVSSYAPWQAPESDVVNRRA
jgi:hypothetical protein